MYETFKYYDYAYPNRGNTMNKKERRYLEEIYKDCVNLERKKDLTEHGAGEGNLAARLLKKKRKRPFKAEKDEIKCKNCKKIVLWI